MKSQDIIILLKIYLQKENKWTYSDLSESLKMSTSTIFAALNRAQKSGLYNKTQKLVYADALLEFLIHGLKYVFPAQAGRMVKGIPTAHSAPPLSAVILSEKDIYVWKDVKGKVRGQAIEPLYKNMSQIIENDIVMYELLALIDAIRVGKARERSLAEMELIKRIGGKNGEE